MSHRSAYPALILAFAAFAAATTAQADVRAKKVCVTSGYFPRAQNSGSPDNECFSGLACTVGVRGDWLDLTDRVTVESGPNASITFNNKGTGDARGAVGSTTTCVPEGTRSREGYISLSLTDISGTGTMRIKLSRPNAIGGHDDDFISVIVKKGETFLATDKEFHAHYGEPEDLTLRGGNLDLLQLKNPGPGDEILSKSDTEARVRLTFTRENTQNSRPRLDERLQFAGPEPAINMKYGWPIVNLSSGSSSQTSVAASNQPNIKATAPGVLFKPTDIRTGTGGLQTGKVDNTFCSGFGPNDAREVILPPFTFTITNTSAINVSQTFAVQVSDSSGRLLYTENVQGLAARASKTISVATWTGRTTRVSLKNSTPCQPPAPCGSLPGFASGCFVASGRPTPDPSLVITVDPARSIPNEASSDNVLGVN